MEAIDELVQFSDSMRQATAVLNDEDIDENSSSFSKRRSTFLNVVALGNTVVALATAALEGFKNEAKLMVVALVDMERVFVPPQHFIRMVQRRMDRQRREEEIKTKSSKKTVDAEQSLLNRASSPQTGRREPGWTLKLMKDTKQGKDVQEGPALKTAGPEGEITAGFLLKKSAKTNGWSRRWFVLNEKTGKLGYTKKQEERHFRGVITLEECNVEELEEEPPSKSSKKPKAEERAPSLVFKITNKVAYKTVLKAHSAVVLKAETAADKAEWLNKLKVIIGAKGGQVIMKADGSPIRQSLSDGSLMGQVQGKMPKKRKLKNTLGALHLDGMHKCILDTMTRKPADPEKELCWMAQEIRGYCEAVLNSLAATVPKAIVLCQVEKAKEDMLNKLYISVSSQSTLRIEELLQEDGNVKRKRDKIQRQSSLLSKLTKQFSGHDNRAAEPLSMSNGTPEENPRSNGSSSGDDWRSAFDSAALGLRFGYSDPSQNGDAGSGSGSGSNSSNRHTPNGMPPAPPGSGYRF